MLSIFLLEQLMDAAFARGLQHLTDAAGDVVAAGGLPQFAEHSPLPLAVPLGPLPDRRYQTKLEGRRMDDKQAPTLIVLSGIPVASAMAPMVALTVMGPLYSVPAVTRIASVRGVTDRGTRRGRRHRHRLRRGRRSGDRAERRCRHRRGSKRIRR